MMLITMIRDDDGNDDSDDDDSDGDGKASSQGNRVSSATSARRQRLNRYLTNFSCLATLLLDIIAIIFNIAIIARPLGNDRIAEVLQNMSLKY